MWPEVPHSTGMELEIRDSTVGVSLLHCAHFSKNQKKNSFSSFRICNVGIAVLGEGGTREGWSIANYDFGRPSFWQGHPM